jgi:hypothetical protein
MSPGRRQRNESSHKPMLGVHVSIRASVSVFSHLRQHTNGGEKVRLQCEEQVCSGSLLDCGAEKDENAGR